MKSKSNIIPLLKSIKQLAKEYYALTGRPLGVTGEIGEYEAIHHLKLEIAEVRQAGYDAIRRNGRRVERLQIKARRLLPDSSPSQRIGQIKLDKHWDAVLLVLLNADFDATHIYRAERNLVKQALLAPGSKARNQRGALAVSKFKSIGRCIWSRDGSRNRQLHVPHNAARK